MKRVPSGVASMVDAMGQLGDKTCLLVGAGLSLPSGLPTAMPLMRAAIDALPIKAAHRQELEKALSPDWELGIGYEDFLRFEQIVQALSQTVDPDLKSFEVLRCVSRPNAYHVALARLIGRGVPVMTTNFDTLIESACRELDIDLRVLVTEDDYAEFVETGVPDGPVLLKLHGSFAAPITGIGAVSATIGSVTRELGASPSKWSLVRNLVSERALVVLGYSGSDDFDVMPALFYNDSTMPVLWVDHETGERDRLPSHLNWFLRRLGGRLVDVSRPSSRSSDNIQCWIGDTRYAVDALLGETSTATSPSSIDTTALLAQFRVGLGESYAVDSAVASLLAARLFRECGLCAVSRAYVDQSLRLGLAHLPLNLWATAHALRAELELDAGNYVEAADEFSETVAIFGAMDRMSWWQFHEFFKLSTVLGQDQELLEAIDHAKCIDEEDMKRYWHLVMLETEIGMHQRARYIRGMLDEDELSAMDAKFAMLMLTQEHAALVERDQRWSLQAAELLLSQCDLLFRMYRNELCSVGELFGKYSIDHRLAEAMEMFQLTCARRHLVAAELLQAQVRMADRWHSWAFESATSAKSYAIKIGNRAGIESAEAILETCEEIGDLPNNADDFRNLPNRFVYADTEL